MCCKFCLYGIFICMLALVFHLCNLKSIGIPYMSYFIPVIDDGKYNGLIRYPIWKTNKEKKLR